MTSFGLGPPSQSSEPQSEHLATFWTLRDPSERDLVCAAHRAGLELRVEYGPEDTVASELFRGVDADERLAEKAETSGDWTLLAKGFREIRSRFRVSRSLRPDRRCSHVAQRLDVSSV